MDFLNFGKKKEGKVNRFNIFSRVKESKREREKEKDSIQSIRNDKSWRGIFSSIL